MKSVFLIGFMGSGKTTFGKKLAAKLNFKFIDLDEEVSKKYGAASVEKLISAMGLDFFRQAENEVLYSLPLENALISTGGGTPCYYHAIDWMKENGTVVFLNVSEEVIFSRLKTTDLSTRPLLKDLDEEGLKKFIHDKLQERLPYYTQAHIQFDPVKQRMEELVEDVLKC